MPSPPRPRPASDTDDSFTAWPLVVTIGATKLITVAVLFVNVRNQESLLLTLATLLPWLGVAVALLAAPIAWHWRMRRARRRREELLKAEWRTSEPATTPGRPLDIAPFRSPE